MADDLTPQQAAAWRVMEGFHTFAAEVITMLGQDHPVALLARRNAQRMRYELLVGEDPDVAEVRDIVTTAILERRARIAALTAR